MFCLLFAMFEDEDTEGQNPSSTSNKIVNKKEDKLDTFT